MKIKKTVISSYFNSNGVTNKETEEDKTTTESTKLKRMMRFRMKFRHTMLSRCCFRFSSPFILFYLKTHSMSMRHFFRLFMDITVLRAAIKWLMHLTMYFQRNTLVLLFLLQTVIIAHHTRTDEHTKR